MANQVTNINGRKQWDSVHKCPRCGHAFKLGDIDLMAVTTGIVDCPNCGWAGQIEIQIVERKKPVK
jgi:transcription elongation factor Elf1